MVLSLPKREGKRPLYSTSTDAASATHLNDLDDNKREQNCSEKLAKYFISVGLKRKNLWQRDPVTYNVSYAFAGKHRAFATALPAQQINQSISQLTKPPYLTLPYLPTSHFHILFNAYLSHNIILLLSPVNII